MVGVQQIDRVVDVVEQTLQGMLPPLIPLDLNILLPPLLLSLKGNIVRFLDKKMGTDDAVTKEERRLGGAPLSLPKIRRNPLIEILAISTGCLNACTYCKTKHARGVLASYTVAELVQRAVEAFEGELGRFFCQIYPCYLRSAT